MINPFIIIPFFAFNPYTLHLLLNKEQQIISIKDYPFTFLFVLASVIGPHAFFIMKSNNVLINYNRIWYSSIIGIIYNKEY
jgi:hypothetical protein